VSAGGACLRATTNNVVEYSTVVEILRDALSHGINPLQVFLDSQLNGLYRICDPVLLRLFLKVRLLECSFDVITYEECSL
jgi:hypothetical protein